MSRLYARVANTGIARLVTTLPDLRIEVIEVKITREEIRHWDEKSVSRVLKDPLCISLDVGENFSRNILQISTHWIGSGYFCKLIFTFIERGTSKSVVI